MAELSAAWGLGFVLVILAIAFGQSAVDKIVDFKGNKEWLEGHFANSPLKGTVGLLLPLLTILEFGSALLAAFALIQLVMLQSPDMWSFYALSAAAITLTTLFFGQRIAKDYPGAATIAGYGALVVVGFICLNLVTRL
ncbi:MAG: hypothetical protein KF812_05210 [Fimbriimonadaceae bacterium]|nr:hypothetical protein [Fimbriimonadaceae bacterium]